MAAYRATERALASASTADHVLASEAHRRATTAHEAAGRGARGTVAAQHFSASDMHTAKAREHARAAVTMDAGGA